MFGTKLKILQRVLKILDIETKGQNLLLYQVLDSIGKVIHTKYDIYRSMVVKTHSELFMVDIDQIFMF